MNDKNGSSFGISAAWTPNSRFCLSGPLRFNIVFFEWLSGILCNRILEKNLTSVYRVLRHKPTVPLTNIHAHKKVRSSRPCMQLVRLDNSAAEKTSNKTNIKGIMLSFKVKSAFQELIPYRNL